MKVPRKLAEPAKSNISYLPGTSEEGEPLFIKSGKYILHSSYKEELYIRIGELVEYYHLKTAEEYPELKDVNIELLKEEPQQYTLDLDTEKEDEKRKSETRKDVG